VMAADDFEARMETLALLRDQEGVRRLAEADRAIARGGLTTRDEMATIMVERERRETE
jgi:PHD/YefM family antitoxin component YafN of YafNO toxin-antitoxin module